MAQIVQYFEFNNVKSKDFDCIADGKNVFNAPARVYEMIEIPGRNGAYALNMGQYENIEVEYECGNAEASYADFIDKIDDFRNALCSVVGYHRLEDTFHPDEYRMAILKSFEVSPIEFAPASRFNVVFDCKPQRWLKSGETAVSVESGDVLTNPTAFASSPLIMVDGYGDMTVNGFPITINSETMGNVTLGQDVATLTIDDALVNTGDVITVAGMNGSVSYEVHDYTKRISSVSISDGATDFPNGSITHNDTSLTSQIVWNAYDAVTFTKGTAGTYTANYSMTMAFSDSTTKTGTLTFRLAYDGSNTITAIVVPPWAVVASEMTIQTGASMTQVTAVSSKSVLGSPIYIDCDLGACYKIEDDTYVNLNSYIELGSELPVLSAGDNTITFDNTYTSVEIIPRWWRI